ncbi:MAG: serine/threonine protein kinase [Myxococcales bacterium]|nr:serine/threonine protein kinase [Myxococcales bacterium]
MSTPRTLGPYRLLRRLGHGGMAEVFEGRAFGASGFEKRVAIKVLLPEHRGDPELEKLLLEEAKLGARLEHRNVVQVHTLGVDEGVHYVVMDFVDGLDLEHALERDELPLELALLVLEEVASALAYAHALADERGPLGLVHRDVSPSNVLLSVAGEVKLADFGIAKKTKLAETTRASIRRGKYAYMSPEQVAGRALGPASDQFGLGVAMVELLTGARPFDGESPVETMDRIREAATPVFLDWPPDLEGIARRCLARAPEDRFATTAALREALAEARRERFAHDGHLARWVRELLQRDPSEKREHVTRPTLATRTE